MKRNTQKGRRRGPAAARIPSSRRISQPWDDESAYYNSPARDERTSNPHVTKQAPASVVAFRFDAEFLASIDRVASLMGWTRTVTVKKLLAAPLALLLEQQAIHDATKGKQQTPSPYKRKAGRK